MKVTDDILIVLQLHYGRGGILFDVGPDGSQLSRVPRHEWTRTVIYVEDPGGGGGRGGILFDVSPDGSELLGVTRHEWTRTVILDFILL